MCQIFLERLYAYGRMARVARTHTDDRCILDPELRRALSIVGGTRASSVIARIRGFIKKAPAEKSELDMNEVIQEVLALARRELSENRVLLELH